MRRNGWWLVLVALLAAGVWLALRKSRDEARPEVSSSASPKVVLPGAPAARNGVNFLPMAEEAARLNAPEGTVDDDLGIVDLMLADYRKQYGGNPVGENEEIVEALRGRNPKGLAWLPEKGGFLDSAGRLVDRWGTPYFFHALSGKEMEIRSAGPDREMWTEDDAVAGK